MTQDNRCAVPFEEEIVINLDTRATSPCCKLGPTPLDPVHGIFNQRMLEVRQAIKDNVRSPHCKQCWDIIDSKGLTRRPFSNHETMDWDNLDIMQPAQRVQINFSKTCQLQCMYCGPWSSTTWQKNMKDYQEFRWHKDSPIDDKLINLYDVIDVSLLKAIHISGGEPMMDDNCIDFLEMLPFDPTRNLSIVTNLSYGPAIFNKLLGIVKSHKNIKLALSLDAVGENVSRKYFNWDLWSKNLESLMTDLQTRLDYAGAKIVVRLTVNSMNYKESANVVRYVLSYRQRGMYGLTFSMGTQFKDELGSMWSVEVDKSAKIVLTEKEMQLLGDSEKYEIEQFNIMLENAVVDPALAEKTKRYIAVYSR